MRLSVWISGVLAIVSVTQGALLGLDYGHEFSKAMLVSPHAPLELVLTADSKRKDVSGLVLKSWKSDVERVFGSGVDSAQVKTPNGALLHVKALLGKKIDDQFNAYHRAHPGVAFEGTERDSVALKSLGGVYPVEEVVGMNLDETIGRANAMLLHEKSAMDKVDSVAIAIPEYFTQDQRMALLAGAQLPRNVKTVLVNDGLTVAINFALKQRDFPAGEKKHFVFYDMGSGSTRASLVSIEQPTNLSEPLVVEFNGYGFDAGLGGSQLTQNVADLLKNKFLEHHPTVRTEELENDARALVRIHQAAEKGKLILSANADASVNIESLHQDIDFKTTITRQEFEQFSEDLNSRIITPVLGALENQFGDSAVTLGDIESLILTGGATRTPLVQKQLSEYFGDELIAKNVNADESSVEGTTIRGIQLFKTFQTKALDVIDRSIFTYSAVFNESGTPLEVFAAGSQYPNVTSYLTPPVTNITNFSIDLREEGKIFKTHTIDTQPITKKFQAEMCPHGVAYNVTLSLSQDRLFDIDGVEAICVNNSNTAAGVFKKLLSGFETNDDEASSEGEESSRGDKIKRLKTVESFPHLKPMSTKESFTLRSHMEDLNDRDAKRLKVQELLNVLESALYDARNYLEEDDVASGGPSEEVSSLATLVDEYLEWLDGQADDTTPGELTKRIKTITSLKGKIALYLDSADEPLDANHFAQMYSNGSELVRQLEKNRLMENETLEALRESFALLELDVVKEFKKLRAPRHLSPPKHKYKDVMKRMETALANVNKFQDLKSFDDVSREKLFELKLQFDSSFEDLSKWLEFEQSAQNFRLNELGSLYGRRQRVIKKREERKNQASHSLDENFNSTTSGEQESSSTSTPLEHDEL
ncbi:LAME_0C03884g1_1 [Lachancea meyersii CBS 8951]|uniref:LAME_0C03884g1_1 n=1 Tax=Lachancea meyersii CBS 8951 TaxID=1266667 RepID=A0A1G4J0Q1_9SACH|nr:LAME_0C03884g1_1 [Lachancea meyersii CBS 8951]